MTPERMVVMVGVVNVDRVGVGLVDMIVAGPDRLRSDIPAVTDCEGDGYLNSSPLSPHVSIPVFLTTGAES